MSEFMNETESLVESDKRNKALKILKDWAESGDPEGMFEYGNIYQTCRNGNDEIVDDCEAAKWYKKALDAGFDIRRFTKLFCRAFLDIRPDERLFHITPYVDILDICENFAESTNDYDSAMYIGDVYRELSASMTDDLDMEYDYYKEKRQVKLYRDKIQKYYKKAERMYEIAAESGIDDAIKEIKAINGILALYDDHLDLKKPKKYLKWAKKGFEMGDRDKYLFKNIAYTYDELSDYEEAFQWYMKGAQEGNEACQDVLERYSYDIENYVRDNKGSDAFHKGNKYYKYGMSKERQDWDNAYNAFLEADKLGDVRATVKLGNMYRVLRNGSCYEDNEAEAVKWYTKAIHSGKICAEEQIAPLIMKVEDFFDEVFGFMYEGPKDITLYEEILEFCKECFEKNQDQLRLLRITNLTRL
ncbi:MAG: sel1 repeat family protein [Lachnospiraceae bacterium]|nr:sel1 repeat family protein [Lachnospiraceae bacterium]